MSSLPNLSRSSIRLRHGIVALATAVVACAQGDPGTPASSDAASDSEIPDVLATVGDERITLTDVRAIAGPQLDQVETQYRRSRSQVVEAALDSVLRERVLQREARRQGTSVDDLIAAEARSRSLAPNEMEIAAWYENNRARLAGRSLDQVRSRIAELLRVERRRDATEKLMRRLHREYRVAVYFQPYRLMFNNEGAPAIGKKDAPVTIVEFSDFQCPFCQRFAPTLKQLAQEFGDRVYVVYRQFPIASIHPNAVKAAEASLCAHEQGKFWEMHDVMFAEQNRLAIAELKEKAQRLGLDATKFESCLDAGRFAAHVQRDLREGQSAGVGGTPAVFVNGILVPGGAVPYETVAAAVQNELDRIQRR